MKKTLFIGKINWDEILLVDNIPQPDSSSEIKFREKLIGGSAMNSCLTYNAIGGDCGMFGSVGNDKYGEKIKNFLCESDIEPILSKAERTAYVKCISTNTSEDPRYFHNEENANIIKISKLKEIIDKYDHVHLSSFQNNTKSNKISQIVKNKNLTLSFNPTQGFQGDDYHQTLHKADLIICNENEYDYIKNKHDIKKIINETDIVKTLGSNGSKFISANKSIQHCGIKIDDLKDTIGAGDAFIGGFLYKYLQDASIKESLCWASSTAAISLENIGSPNNYEINYIHNILEKRNHNFKGH